MKIGFRAVAIPAALMVACPAHAEELFSVSGTVSNGPGQTQTFDVSFDKAKDVIQFTETDNFRQQVGFYVDDFSSVTSTIAFRGLPINFDFGLGSQTINFAIPDIGEVGSFTGVDRDDALEQLKDYLLENSGDFLRKFQRALLKSSPNDPTAGNPNSLQSQMVGNDFAIAGFDAANTMTTNAQDNENRIFVGISGGTFKARGVKGTTVTVPFSYTIRYDADPRYQLQFAMPLTYMNQSGAITGAGTLAAGFQFPLTAPAARNQWYLTPRVSLGATGSVDAAAASILANASITSRYVHDAGSLGSFILANMVAYNFSIPFKVNDIRGDYRIRNLVFKNGLLFQKPLDFKLFGGNGTAIQASYAMTNFTGTDLYMNSFHEVSLAAGTLNDGLAGSLLRIGLTGTMGKHFKKYAVSFGYTF